MTFDTLLPQLPVHCVCEDVMHSQLTGKPQASLRTLRTNSTTCALSCGYASVATTMLSWNCQRATVH